MSGKLIVVMGVSGCGKSTLAKQLASHLDYRYVEADDFHSAAAKAQMARGKGLSDAQRIPWLQAINRHCREMSSSGHGILLACSALKLRYRKSLSHDIERVTFIWIEVSRPTVETRLKQRHDHFANEKLLHSQFDDLEAPDNESNCIKVSGELSSAELLIHTLEKLANE